MIRDIHQPSSGKIPIRKQIMRNDGQLLTCKYGLGNYFAYL